MTVPNINQFGISTVQGQMDGLIDSNVLSGIISPNETTTLVAGQPVKLENSAGGAFRFLALTSPTDAIFGFIARTVKDINYKAAQAVEVAMDGGIMYMTANGAIARGKTVECVLTGVFVQPSAGVNSVAGIALDQASNSGDLVRVLIKTPSAASSTASRTLNATVTLAQINAGAILIPAVAGKQILVTNFVERVTGAFATGTSVNLQSGTTSVIVESTAEAGLTNGAVLVPGSANVTLGAGFGTLLPVGESLNVANIGAPQTVGTSIQYDVTYVLV